MCLRFTTFIYAIFDNSWVSPMQVIYNKGDMNMMRSGLKKIISKFSLCFIKVRSLRENIHL